MPVGTAAAELGAVTVWPSWVNVPSWTPKADPSWLVVPLAST